MSYFDSSTLAAIQSGRLIARKFVYAEFQEGTLGWWNDAGDITVNGIDYAGDCAIGPISGLAGLSDLSMASVSVSLSMVDPQLRDAFAIRTWHLRPMTIQILLFDPTMRTAYATPLQRYRAMMDKVSYPQSTSDKAEITVKLADFLSRGLRSPAAFRTDGDQRMRLATDSSFRYVSTVDRPVDVVWGTRQPKYGNAVVRGLTPTKV